MNAVIIHYSLFHNLIHAVKPVQSLLQLSQYTHLFSLQGIKAQGTMYNPIGLGKEFWV